MLLVKGPRHPVIGSIVAVKAILHPALGWDREKHEEYFVILVKSVNNEETIVKSTCDILYLIVKVRESFPQVDHTHEGALLQVKKRFCSATAPLLSRESTVTVPSATGQAPRPTHCPNIKNLPFTFSKHRKILRNK